MMQALLPEVEVWLGTGVVDFLFIDFTLITRLWGSGPC